MAENNVGRMRQVKIAFIEHLLKGIEKIQPITEPPRVSRRPNFLREYPNEKYLFT